MKPTTPALLIATALAAYLGAPLAAPVGAATEIRIGSFELLPEQTITWNFSLPGEGLRVIGVDFKGVYTDDGEGGNWASDTRLVAAGPQNAVAIGGVDAFIHDWSFSGVQSDASGIYADTHPDVLNTLQGGPWRITFRYDYDGGRFVKCDEVVVILISRCAADVDASGRVDFADLDAVLQGWGQHVIPRTGPDIDGDGLVGFADLNFVLESWECAD